MRWIYAFALIGFFSGTVCHAESGGTPLTWFGIAPMKQEIAQQSRAGSVYWNKGVTFEIPDSGVTLRVNTLMQPRYSYTSNRESGDSTNTSSFSMRRARLILSGTAVDEQFFYQSSVDFVGGTAPDGSASAAMRDGYLEWRGSDGLALRMGQFKTNLGRQFLSSASALQFADRSVVTSYFSFDRQSGALGSAKLLGGDLELAAGIYNGQSDGESGPNRSGLDTKHTGIVSARYAALGKSNALVEGDLDWSEEFGMTLGGSYGFADATNTIGTERTAVQQHISAVDLSMKYRGFSLHTELFNNDINDGIPNGGAAPIGFYAQTGYFVMPQTVEVAARYSLLDCDNGKAARRCAGNDNISEVAVGVNYFWWGNNLKAQLNYVRTVEDAIAAGRETSDRVLLQLQSYL